MEALWTDGSKAVMKAHNVLTKKRKEATNLRVDMEL